VMSISHTYLSFHAKFVCLFAELYKMVCDPDETDLNIHIPAVMLPLDAGARLEKMLTNTSSGELPFNFQNISGCFLVQAMGKL